MHSHVHTSTIHNSQDTETTFLIWKQFKCPSIDKWIKKMWYRYIMEYYSAIKRNKIMPFAVKWMQIQSIYYMKSERERQISYDMIYMQNLKYDTKEPIYEIEQNQGHREQTGGCQAGGKQQRKFRISRCKLVHTEWINNKVLYNTGNYIQHLMINHNERKHLRNASMCIIKSLLYSSN